MTRGILFDSGGVLTRPVGGRWNPRFDFEEVLQRHHLGAPPERFEAAFRVGQAHLDAEDTNKARDDYHRAILRELGVDDPTADLLAELDRPLDVPVLETFPEVPEVLAELRRRGIRMAVVTDNWGTAPSNRALFDQIGIGHYFETFAVSEELGCAKPDPASSRLHEPSSGSSLRNASSWTTTRTSSEPRANSATRPRPCADRPLHRTNPCRPSPTSARSWIWSDSRELAITNAQLLRSWIAPVQAAVAGIARSVPRVT